MAAQKPVLLIEDTTSILMIYDALLTRSGYQTILAETGQEALLQFEDAAPEVVLLDLILPDRDGLELLQEFLIHSPQTKVIVVTANGSMAKAVEAMRLGAVDFLVKPVAEDKLIASVAEAFAGYARAADLSPEVIADQKIEKIQSSQAMRALLGLSLAEMERAFIEATIAANNGSLPKAAEMLGLAPSTLYRKRDQWKK